MDSKLFGAAVAGVVVGLGIARALPSGTPSTNAGAIPTATPVPAQTPFACVRDASAPAAEVATHAGRPTLFISWTPGWGSAYFPTYERIRAAYASRGLDVVGVTSSKEKAEEACRDHRLRWPQIIPADLVPWQTFFENQAFVVVDREGHTTFRGWLDPSVLRAIEEVLGAPKREVNGRVLHRGRPIAGLSGATPKLEIRNAFGWSPNLEDVEYFKATGSFVAKLAPGTYSAYASAGDDYFGYATFGVPDHASDAAIDVEIAKQIHLTGPIDSRIPQGRWDDPSPFHPSPVRVAWDPVPGAKRYTVSIWSQTAQTPSTSVTDAFADLTLQPAEYNLAVYAYDDKGQTIGRTRFAYEGYPNGNDSYRFRVPPK